LYHITLRPRLSHYHLGPSVTHTQTHTNILTHAHVSAYTQMQRILSEVAQSEAQVVHGLGVIDDEGRHVCRTNRLRDAPKSTGHLTLMPLEHTNITHQQAREPAGRTCEDLQGAPDNVATGHTQGIDSLDTLDSLDDNALKTLYSRLETLHSRLSTLSRLS